jgi:tricorn protease
VVRRASTNQGYLRYPSIHGDRVVFVCEDDLWLAPAEGGLACRLTAGNGDATWARFSPDGERIAFVSREEGPADVYVMPTTGGVATRLTHHGQVRQVAAWTPDGSAIQYASSIGRPDRFEIWLHQVAPGQVPRPLAIGPATAISHGPGGGVVIARCSSLEPAFWKRYRGGGVGVLWIDPDGGGTYHRLIDLDGNLSNPCWVAGRVHFLSDHEGCANVYSCTAGGGDLRRHTDHDGFYARSLTDDGRRLVYHAGGDVYVLEPEADGPRRLELETRSSLTQRRRRHVAARQYLDSAALSPGGSELAIAARGRPFAFSNWVGPITQLSEQDGVRHRLVAWLHGDRRLLAVACADEAGEHLVVLTADGSAAPRRLALDVGRVGHLEVSPAEDVVALSNHRNELLLVDLRTEDPALRTLDHSGFGPMRGVAWSPDGRWLAYGCPDTRETCAIRLCEVETGAISLATRPVLWDFEPAFDPDGRYLYFIGREWRDPVYDEIHWDVDLPRAQRPHAICLRADQPSPFDPAARSPRGAAGEGPPAVRIDLDGIQDRVVPFPVPDARYRRVQGVRGGRVLFISSPMWGAPWRGLRDRGAPAGTLECFEVESRRRDRLADGVHDCWVGRDGATLLYRAGDRLRVAPLAQLPGRDGDRPGRESGWIDLDRVRVPVEPMAEWRQMFFEAWTLQRDHFWTPDLGGVDWQEALHRYLPLVERVATRSELADILWELLGELGTSHLNVIGGDHRRGRDREPGFLGVDWEVDPDSGAYRIAHIVHGDPLDAAATSPLSWPGLDVRPGDAVLAINGRDLDASLTPGEALAGEAGREVTLTVRRPGRESRRVTVTALADDRTARYHEWANANRRAVHEATGGRVGYVHVPDMFSPGFALFHRQFLVEYDRDALIFDIRGNIGGHVSALLLEKLARRRVAYGISRWVPPQPWPPHSPAGPVVCLTNELAGSDGDMFSQSFKELGVGPLVGMRTWGGMTGISYLATHWLADGTITTYAELAYLFNNAGLSIENRGAEPDVEVDNAPHEYARGVDAQLERAVSIALERLRHHPPHRPRPAEAPSMAAPALPERRPSLPARS